MAAIAEYPPGYFAESANAEIHSRQAIRVMSNPRRRLQADVIRFAFRYYWSSAAEIFREVELWPAVAVKSLFEHFCVANPVELERAYGLMNR